MTELSDDLLVAYVDGQLAKRQAIAVEKVLDQDDVLADRVETLKEAHARLEAAFEAILAGEELATAAAAPPMRPVRSFIPHGMLANVTLGLIGLMIALALAFAGYGWRPAAPQTVQVPDVEIVGSIPMSWQETAARAQSLIGRSTLEVQLETQGNSDFVALQLGQAIGPGFALPDLASQGYRFKRAQLLHAGAQSLAQLLYLGDKGAPLALYAKAGGSEADPAFKQYGLVGTVAWSEGGMDYLLAGEIDQARLMELAGLIRNKEQAR